MEFLGDADRLPVIPVSPGDNTVQIGEPNPREFFGKAEAMKSDSLPGQSTNANTFDFIQICHSLKRVLEQLPGIPLNFVTSGRQKWYDPPVFP